MFFFLIRLTILTARDNLIRQLSYSFGDIAGTCRDYCPERERLQRKLANNLDEYERKFVMIKKLPSEPEIAQLPHEIRPEPVLRMTMDYILKNNLDLDDTETKTIDDICEWFCFLNDRLCCIRHEISIQKLCTPGSISMMEKCIRFHIHCLARLIGVQNCLIQLQSVNMDNLIIAIESLLGMYDRFNSDQSSICCPNEPEFRAFAILLKANEPKSLTNILDKCTMDVKSSKEIECVLKINMCIQSQNIQKFSLLINDDSLSYMHACLTSIHFRQMRQNLVYSLEKQLQYFKCRKRAPLSILVNGMKLSDVTTRVNIWSDFDDDG